MTSSRKTIEEAVPHVQRWVNIVGLFIAPTTVITSLCFYFGYVFTRTYFAYFGVDTDAIGYTVAEYVLQSVSVLYGPMIVLLLAWVALSWTTTSLRRMAANGTRTSLLRRLAWSAIVFGAIGAASGLVGVVVPGLLSEELSLAIPMALGAGTILLLTGSWMLRAPGTSSASRRYLPAERASLVAASAVLVLAAFWVTNIFATSYGRNQAEIRVGKLWSQETSAILTTTTPLDVPTDLIVRVPADEPPSREANTLRYKCFRVLAARGDRWILVPARWTPEYGYALIFTQSPGDRITVRRLKGIAETEAANWSGDWRCPEDAPPQKLAMFRN
jgi:hypothetical protein